MSEHLVSPVAHIWWNRLQAECTKSKVNEALAGLIWHLAGTEEVMQGCLCLQSGDTPVKMQLTRLDGDGQAEIWQELRVAAVFLREVEFKS